MFYSRPGIEPLGWDLIDLPVPNGSRNFDAFTSDGRPVDIRFSGGWLMVELGPPDASPDCAEMEEVLSVPIAPFGTMDIAPEQICDILGVTVDGQRIDSAELRHGSRGFDWSGRTTYWESTHLMQPKDDAREFVQRLCDAFPSAILVQPEWGSGGRCRCRQIRFLMSSDEVAALGMDPGEELLRKMLSGREVSSEEFEAAFAFRIDFVRDDRPEGDPTGARYVRQNGGAELNYQVIHHRRYRIRAQYPTADPTAQVRAKTLLSVVEGSFCRGLEVINLQTGAVLTSDLADDADERSYSIALRNQWRAARDRYFFVGKSAAGDDSCWEPGTFWGARPWAGA